MTRQLRSRVLLAPLLSALLVAVSLSGFPGAIEAQLAPAGCTDRPIACGETAMQTLVVNPCNVFAFGFIGATEFWHFDGQEGDTVTIELEAGEGLIPVLVLLDPAIRAQDDNPEGLSTARITFPIDHSGPWFLTAILTGFDTNPFYSVSLTCQTSTPPECMPVEETLCLSNDRFQVEVDWRTDQGTSGQGQAIELTPDTGYFWFFQEENVEMVVKVLDACSFADRFWVFAGGLTNVEVDLTVTDTQTGTVQTYSNPLNTPFQPIQDTNAFATCP